MPFLQVTQAQAEVLRAMLKAWPRIAPRIDAIIGNAAPVEKQTQLGKVEKPAPFTESGAWFKIVSASSVGTNQWNYKGRRMKSGHTSDYTGLTVTVETTEFNLRNAYEAISLGGLTGVSALVAIATNSIVYARPEKRDNKQIYVFERPNDITCPASRPGAIGGTIEVTSDTTLDDTMRTIIVSTSAGDVTLTLPPAASIGEYEYWINNNSGHFVIVDADGAETIDGILTQTVNDGDSIHLTCDGSTWTAI